MNKEELPFLGLEIKDEGPNDLILKALGFSISLLNIEEFMTVIGFVKDPVMTNYFWQAMVKKQGTHIDTLLLECLGFEGDFKTQQAHVKRFIKSNGISLLELSSSDTRISEYPTIKEEMKDLKANVIANRKWLIIDHRDFKKAIMKLNTKNGDKIREYYICLEELIKMYLEYSLYFRDREAKIKEEKSKQRIVSLEEKLEQMEINASTERSLAAERENDAVKRHSKLLGYAEDTKEQLDNLTDIVEDHNELLPDKFMDVLKPLTENLVMSPQENSLKARFIVLDLGNGHYRIARGQTRNVSRVKADYPNAKILLDLPLVGAQDRMTEVRKQVRNKIKLNQFGDATFKASLVANLDKQFEIDFLQSILDVHEKFQSIPVDVIKQAREELSITT
jgi:hypothetical protein